MLPIVTQDVRRGAAADVAHLAMPLRGGSLTDAAQVLNHSTGETNRGLTRKYVGHSREDTWKRRLEDDLVDHFGPEVVRRSFKRQRQSSAAVRAIANGLNLDMDNECERDQARIEGRKRLREDWVNQSMQNDSEDDQGASVTSGDSTRSPELLSAHFSISQHDFRMKFARRNDIRNEVAGGIIPAGAAYGGSRDPPSRWQYSCTNAPICDKTFDTRHLRDLHAKNCNPAVKKIHILKYTLCESTHPKQAGLNTHIKHVHGDWIPRKCGEVGCTSTELFQNRSAY